MRTRPEFEENVAVPSSQPNCRFGAYEVDRRTGELRRSGVRIRIQEQPFRVLTALLERPGEVVTREELRQVLWPNNTFVDFEHSLNAAVNKLREALGDSANLPCFVETVPRRGYRFIYPLDRPVGIGPDKLKSGRQDAAANAGQMESTHWWERAGVWVMAVSALLAFIVSTQWFRAIEVGPPVAATPVPLTSYPGIETYPSISPDGNQVAFVRSDETEEHDGIWIKAIGPGPPYQLTHNSNDSFPAWSPDGKYVAFARYSVEADKWTLYLIPPFGGVERPVGEVPGSSWVNIAWSADGKSLLVPRAGPPNGSVSTHQLDVETGQWTQLVAPLTTMWHSDLTPTLSPDSTAFAFSRFTGGQSAILLSTTGEGEMQQLAQVDGVVHGLAWSPDGRDIIYGLAADGGPALPPRLWRVPRAGGTAQPLWGAGDRGWYPSVSPHKARLVYSRVADEWNIWRYPLRQKASAPKKVVFSSQNESQPQISPDGTRIVFISSRSGSLQLWRSDSDGSNETQLTSAHRPGSPEWSRDGKYIAFDDAVKESWDIFVVNSDGGSARQLTFHSGLDARPSWSKDGQWIYFNSERTGENQIWRVPFGDGKAEQITFQGGCCPVLSPDGEWIYYAKGYNEDGIWRVPSRGGEEVAVFPSLKDPGWGWWDVTDKGIYFVPAEAVPPAGVKWALSFFSFDTEKVTHVTNLGKPPSRAGALDVSPDGSWFLYGQWDQSGADLMLVDEFR